MKIEYDKTLNLLKTDFPMRGSLSKKEPEILKWWEKINIYKLIQNKNYGKKKFILHDGPPYANGDIHLGTALNKILKDIIIKYKSMKGYYSPFVPGWDTHGLPIAKNVSNNNNINFKESISSFRNRCRDYALKFVEIQKESFKRLGIRGDFENSYLTLDPEYESDQIKIFGKMVEKGYIYKGKKPVYWCIDCKTALAEAEVEYKNINSFSIYVKFKLLNGKKIIKEKNTYFIIWTTTPWTLPSNVAISVNPKAIYSLIKSNTKEEFYIIAKDLLKNCNKFLNFDHEENIYILKEFKGEELEFMVCENPIIKRDSLVILGNHVTLDVGTGCVHTAPAHGLEDFEVSQKYNLPIISIVNSRGIFNEKSEKYKGEKIFKVNEKIIQELKENKSILFKENINHSYPHCWRCKKQLIFRATEQWFASISKFRDKILNLIDKNIKWIPSWGKDRIFNMISERSDWCISRQREWGVPIPVFYCKNCKKPILDKVLIDHIACLIKKYGSNIWFDNDFEKLIIKNYECKNCKCKFFEKEMDIMDVWFDSGVSYEAVLKKRFELNYPADLYFEGSDQYRGWFNSSLSISVATEKQSPYKMAISHGYVVDKKGLKMSKSLGNGIDPKNITNQLGADILRLWVASEDYRKDIGVSNDHLKQITEYYRKIRNTLRFLHGNLFDYHSNDDFIEYEKLNELDKFMLYKLNELVKKVTFYYDNYEFYMAFFALHNFCSIDMSSLYLDIIKDRMYASFPSDFPRRSSQNVIFKILNVLIALLTPILSFTMEEIWFYFKQKNSKISPQLLDWPKYYMKYKNEKINKKWTRLFSIREIILKALEQGRKNGLYGNSLNAKIILKTNDINFYKFLKKEEKNILDLAIVSRIDILNLKGNDFDINDNSIVENLWIKVENINKEKCKRCWMISEGIGENSEYPTLCPRCVVVINKLKGIKKYDKN